MKVFISYSKRDPGRESAKFVEDLARFLAERGVDAAIDTLAFRHAYPLVEEIADAIYSAERYVLLASPEALQSPYVQKEITYARHRAVELSPKPFIHVIDMTRGNSLDYLPRDLRSSICHTTIDKSRDLILHELFLSLHNREIGHLVAEQLNRKPGTDWLRIERCIVLNILSPDGTAEVSARHAVLNMSTEPQQRSDYLNLWFTEELTPPDLEVSISLPDGRMLEPSLSRRMYRGRDSVGVRVEFPEAVPPGEVQGYSTSYVWPGAFDLSSGDVYVFDAHKVYGYLRFDVLLPRFGIDWEPLLHISDPVQGPLVQPMSRIAWNVFSFSTIPDVAGARYEIVLGRDGEEK